MVGRRIISVVSLIIAFSLMFSMAISAHDYKFNEVIDTNNQTVNENDKYIDDISKQQICSCCHSIQDSLAQETTVTIETTADEFISGLLESNLNIKGTVATDLETIDINDYYDFDNTDSFSVARWAVEHQLITEIEKIEIYCELINLRQFQNVGCLTGIYRELDIAANSEWISNELELKSKIENTISASTASTESATEVYNSTNFSIYYDSGISQSEAMNVANFFEDIREQFIYMGFRQPIKETGKSRYIVTLVSGQENGWAYASQEDPVVGNTSAVSFDFNANTSLYDGLHETIVHEYFHGIQFAYNREYTPNETAWFAEGAANWASTIINTTYQTGDYKIGQYINSRYAITAENNDIHYGTSLLLLTIGYLYDGYSTIRRIYEEYADYPLGLSFVELRNIIDEALEYYGGSFDEAYRAMSNYKYSPAEYFAPVHPGGSAVTSQWSPRIFVCNTSIFHAKNINPSSVVTARSIQSYSSDYFQFNPNELCQDALLKITITFNGTGASEGICYSHVEKSDGTKTFTKLDQTGTNTYSAIFSHYGDSIQSVGLIVSNLYTDAVTYSVTCLVEQGTTETLTIGSSNRYTEKIMSLGEREYKDFVITFTTGGNRVLQTFGTNDTYLELFNMNGTKLAGNSSADDAGYATNALISYDFTANTQYRIRVTFYSSTQSGDIKLAIIPTYSTDTYEDIYTLNDYTLGLTSSYLRYNVNMYVYKYTSSRELTMNLSSSVVDTYLYIIDPRSTAPIEEANQDFPDMTKNAANLYNDDAIDSSNSQIKKRFYPNVAYLVIAAQYNPSSTSAEGELYIDFE